MFYHFRFFRQVPLIIQLIDVNDETPTFEKALYEFILTTDLKNFTIPAFIKAIDNDAEAPNNIVRYEIIHGNYENKFMLNEITGQLMLREPLIKRSKRQTNAKPDMDVFVLTARAFDLGVPVRFSTTTVRIYPPESRTRAVSFLVPGYSPDRQKLEEQLSDLTGGRVVIQDVKPYTGNLNGVINPGNRREEKSMVTATVIYDSDTVVDVSSIQKRLMQNNDQSIVAYEDAVRIIETPTHLKDRNDDNNSQLFFPQSAYKAENRVLFWLLIFLALLLAIGILTLLLCCICSWCPLYAASR